MSYSEEAKTRLRRKSIFVEKTFGIASSWEVQGFESPPYEEFAPIVEEGYVFDRTTTLSILAGFEHNRRVFVQGLHGTGKSTHIEQVAARLNWPVIRLNLDGHVSRLDLIGRDVITVEDNHQVTRFSEGLIPFALRRPIALVLDEYDAGRPDVMFVIQQLLEEKGRLTVLEKNEVVTPHPFFRIFATANTSGMGDSLGIYHGTEVLNQGQIDRWHIVTSLSYLPPLQEEKIILQKVPHLQDSYKGLEKTLVSFANLVRASFLAGDVSVTLSPRTVVMWAENTLIFQDVVKAFEVTFFNKCDTESYPVIAELYQRVFGVELKSSVVHHLP